MIAVSALVLVPLIELGAPAVSRADDGCGVGMYWNTQTFQCEPWAANVYVDPYVPVPIPVWLPDVDVNLDPDIDINRGQTRWWTRHQSRPGRGRQRRSTLMTLTLKGDNGAEHR